MHKLPLFLLMLFSVYANGREGMWLPQLLKELNEPEMKSMGMQISAEDIYSINKSSLKDAVLQFGGGCTGELVPSKGLLITNHHCGFSQIQSVSTIEKNYLNDGFWAKSFEEEIPCPGLNVTFIREIKEVTNDVLFGISDTMNEDLRSELVKNHSDSIIKTITGSLKGIVRSFYNGNKYYLFITEVYMDVRFVGAPPKDIAKFGGETDNWMWPRHSADFSLFRIYVDKDNKPAKYSPENIPYSSKQFLTINAGGIKEEDFVFVMGFPGRTNEYLLSPGLELINKQTNPNRIELSRRRLDIMRKEILQSDTVRLQYSPRFASLENVYKKMTGELEGFVKFDALNHKKEFEKKIIQKIKMHPGLMKDTSLINKYSEISEQIMPLSFVNDFFNDGFSGIELFTVSNRFKLLIDLCNDKNSADSLITQATTKLKKDLVGFYKNYNVSVDKQICASILNLAFEKLDKKFIPDEIFVTGQQSPDFIKFTESLYKRSYVSDSARINKLLSGFRKKDGRKLIKDPAFRLVSDFSVIQTNLQARLSPLSKELSRLQRIYMNDLLVLDPSGKTFPDANSTLRITYGNIKSMSPRDGIKYEYYTTLDGVLEKSMTGNIDYTIPDKFKSMIQNKDFGGYGMNGVMPVNFIANTHTTGGNSGSPCLNAKGELVGLNFDRVWEGVLSDYLYDEKYCRNVCVDVRYILYLIEKFGNANRLIEEMHILH